MSAFKFREKYEMFVMPYNMKPAKENSCHMKGVRNQIKETFIGQREDKINFTTVKLA